MQPIGIAKTNYGIKEVKAFSLTQSSVIQYGSTLKLDFLFTYFHFEKISSFCSETGHSRFFVASFAQLLEFSCAPDDFTAPRAQKRSLGRSLPLYLTIRPRLIKFSMYLYLVSLYHECQNYSPGIKFGPTRGGGGHKFYLRLYRENFRNLPVPSHMA